MDCLVYTGAVLISKRVKGTRVKKNTQKQPEPSQKEVEVEHLRRTVGWLECEIRRRKEGSKATLDNGEILDGLHPNARITCCIGNKKGLVESESDPTETTENEGEM